MNTKLHKHLGLLVLLGCLATAGGARADEQMDSHAIAQQSQPVQDNNRLAWQRVGSPSSLEA